MLKETASRTVSRWCADGDLYYVKAFRPVSLGDRLRQLIRGPHGRWEAGRIEMAVEYGVPTAPVVAVGWSDDRCESVLITRGLADVMPLGRFRAPYEVPGSITAIPDRGGLIDAVADLVARLHQSGLQHGDLHAGNVVVRRDPDGWRAWLIDLAALRTSQCSRRRFENLVRLDYSLLFSLTDADRRRFFRRYWKQADGVSIGSRRQALQHWTLAKDRFAAKVIPTVDAAWSRSHRKVVEISNGVGLASLGSEWLAELAGRLPRTWNEAAIASTGPGVEHRVLVHDTPHGLRTLRLIRFAKSSTVTARQAWDATHAALRRGVTTIVPWLSVELRDAGYLVCCQTDDAIPDAEPGRLRTLDGRWTGVAAVERLVTASKPATSSFIRRAAVLWLALLLTASFGCRELNRQPTTGLPARHTVKSEQLVVQSDIKLPKQHPLIKDLESLRQDIARTLNLPLQEQPVTVYLFENELRYAQYLQVAFPNLPPRRAYFVGTPDDLAVYTFWGEKIQEDLRHEYTHGVLHATLKDVPLWLDEGLAEYFEVTSQPRGLNGEYVTRLADALKNGWQPDIRRLEQMDTVSQMQKGDYLEAWAWVHFMLHDSDVGRDVLLAYLADLRENAQPGKLSDRLVAALPSMDERFRAYAATLKPDVQTARSQSE